MGFVCLFPIQISAAVRFVVKHAMYTEECLGHVLRGLALPALWQKTVQSIFRPGDRLDAIFNQCHAASRRRKKRFEMFQDVLLREACGPCS